MLRNQYSLFCRLGFVIVTCFFSGQTFAEDATATHEDFPPPANKEISNPNNLKGPAILDQCTDLSKPLDYQDLCQQMKTKKILPQDLTEALRIINEDIAGIEKKANEARDDSKQAAGENGVWMMSTLVFGAATVAAIITSRNTWINDSKLKGAMGFIGSAVLGLFTGVSGMQSYQHGLREDESKAEANKCLLKAKDMQRRLSDFSVFKKNIERDIAGHQGDISLLNCADYKGWQPNASK